MVPFLGELCRGVIEASGRTDIVLHVFGDDRLCLDPDSAVPTALIVAEAVANAIEHGFAESRPGRIEIDVGQGAEGVKVIVHDDGWGLPPGFSAEQSSSLGLRIATTLARGQGGSFRLDQSGGTLAILTLPLRLLASGK